MPPASPSAQASPPAVTKDWPVADIVTLYPQVAPILAEYGLHCVGCAASGLETLAEGCLLHGMTEDDVDNLVADLHAFLASIPAHPEELTMTTAAALVLRSIAAEERLPSCGLSVQGDPSGNFFMEFRECPGEGEKIFRHGEVTDVAVFASVSVLSQIGGAVIDVRDGKFTLDVGEKECCQGKEAQCGCALVGALSSQDNPDRPPQDEEIEPR